MKSLLFILTIVFVGAYLSFGACGLLGPEDKEKGPVVELEPGSRNYSWSVDTLSSPPGGFVYSILNSLRTTCSECLSEPPVRKQ